MAGTAAVHAVAVIARAPYIFCYSVCLGHHAVPAIPTSCEWAADRYQLLSLHGGCAGPRGQAAKLPCVYPIAMALGNVLAPL